MSPKRVQRRRTAGWRMPKGAVYVGRPSVWGNPYKVGDPHPDHGLPMTALEAVALFEQRYIDPAVDLGPRSTRMVRRELAGRDLVCWCPLDAPCHADVLLRIANAEPPDPPRAQIVMR